MSETASTPTPVIDDSQRALPTWILGAAAFVAAYTVIQLKTVIVYCL